MLLSEVHQIHTRTVRRCDFYFLTEWFYLVFRKTIFTGQYLDRSRDRGTDHFTGQYPVLAYTA